MSDTAPPSPVGREPLRRFWRGARGFWRGRNGIIAWSLIGGLVVCTVSRKAWSPCGWATNYRHGNSELKSAFAHLRESPATGAIPADIGAQ